MQGPRSGEFTRALARARKGRGGETRRRSTVVQRDARRLNVLAPAKEVQTLIPYRELRVVPLTKTLGKVANNTATTAGNVERTSRGRQSTRRGRNPEDIHRLVLQALSRPGSNVLHCGERIARPRDGVGSHPRLG
jgi:hypothetical protein